MVTLDAVRAAGLSAAEPEMVLQMTLARLLAELAPTEGVEFLKVDVEGWEEEYSPQPTGRRYGRGSW